ncbi:MAG: ABC transporter ATP-binding protein [Thermoanaerobaculia bacterium]
MSIVFAKGLKKYYKDFLAVRGVDFEIHKGECFGFLGPNGAGKTTVMKMIQCFMPPSEGTLEVFEKDVLKYPSEIKEKIGVMPQENNLDPDLSVEENLMVYANYFDIKKKKARERAEELLKFVEMENLKKSKIEELSGGMKRKLVLARALINDPELIILDEPTTGLDPHSRHNVWDMLKFLKSQGKTSILTTHYIEEADRLCTRVAIMDTGKIVEIDSPKILKEKYGGDLEEVYLKITGKKLEN